MHSGCADPCDFPKCGKLDCIICGSGGPRSRFPLGEKKKKEEVVSISSPKSTRGHYRCSEMCEFYISIFRASAVYSNELVMEDDVNKQEEEGVVCD